MEMEESPVHSHTEIVQPSTSTTPPILRLRLQKKKPTKTVVWSDGTVDNEHMNKKKSKCCCIYKKPLAFGESSSEEEEECEHCFGHPEKRVKTHAHRSDHHEHHAPSDESNVPDSTSETEMSGHYQCDSGVCTLKNHDGRDPKGVAE